MADRCPFCTINPGVGLCHRDFVDIQKRYQVQRVDIVIYPGFEALEAVGAVHVFEYANARMAKAGLSAAYELRVCAPEPGLIRSDTQLVLEARHAPALYSDIALIVGAPDIDRALAEQPGLVEWCRQVARRPTTLAGVCTGAFFLAEAGSLDSHRATTHWSVSGQQGKRYPRAMWLRMPSSCKPTGSGPRWRHGGADPELGTG